MWTPFNQNIILYVFEYFGLQTIAEFTIKIKTYYNPFEVNILYNVVVGGWLISL